MEHTERTRSTIEVHNMEEGMEYTVGAEISVLLNESGTREMFVPVGAIIKLNGKDKHGRVIYDVNGLKIHCPRGYFGSNTRIIIES